jgi:hypothetical protein
MTTSLTIESTLEHDGDELILFAISASSNHFSGSTEAWGHVDELAELASALHGFPSQTDLSVAFTFGTRGVGTCALNFFCLDGLGHLGVWITMEAHYPVRSSEKHESARIFIAVDPAAVDSFTQGLRAFGPGMANRAVLHGTSA